MMDIHSVRLANANDLEGWLILARAVEPLFGPMADVPEFRGALAEAIAGDRALACSRFPGGPAHAILGGIVISAEGNSIEWLAVSASARGLGIGGRLLEAALGRLDPTRAVSVQTFAPSIPEGMAARHLYRKFGFEDHGPMGPNPAGLDTVLMVRPPAPQPHPGR